MSNLKIVKNRPVFTELEIRVKENSYPVKLSQLYGRFIDDGDVEIRINGAISVKESARKAGQICAVNATICNSKDQILYVLKDYHEVPMIKGVYHAFSMFCCKVERFYSPEDVAYVEVYVTVEDKKKNNGEIGEYDEL